MELRIRVTRPRTPAEEDDRDRNPDNYDDDENIEGKIPNNRSMLIGC